VRTGRVEPFCLPALCRHVASSARQLMGNFDALPNSDSSRVCASRPAVAACQRLVPGFAAKRQSDRSARPRASSV
jgi:hypothetical protein